MVRYHDYIYTFLDDDKNPIAIAWVICYRFRLQIKKLRRYPAEQIQKTTVRNFPNFPILKQETWYWTFGSETIYDPNPDHKSNKMVKTDVRPNIFSVFCWAWADTVKSQKILYTLFFKSNSEQAEGPIRYGPINYLVMKTKFQSTPLILKS